MDFEQNQLSLKELEHNRSCSSCPPNTDIHKEIEMGDKLYEQGNYVQAFNVYKQISDKATSQEETDPNLASIYKKIGLTVLKKANYVEAHLYLNKAHKIKESLEAGDVLGLTSIKISIGEVFLAQADYSKALDIFQNSLETMSNTKYAELPKEVLTCYNNLASLYEYQGKYNDSLLCAKKAIDLIPTDKEEYKPEIASSYCIMGNVYRCLADYSQAMKYADISLKIREELYGPYHPDLAFSLSAIGHIYFCQDKLGKGLEAYNRALEIRIKAFGEFHPIVSGTYSNIALVYRNLGDFEKALEYYRKCIKIHVAFFGEFHPQVATIYNNMANVFYAQRKYEQARKTYNQSLILGLKFLVKTILMWLLFTIILETFILVNATKKKPKKI